MADYPIYRLVKGTQLTFTEMDNNLRWLSSNMSGSNITISGSVMISGSGVSLFSGSFSGSGAKLYDIPASSIIGLELSRIASGSATASISPNKGLLINTSVVQGSGSAAYGYSNFVNGQSDEAFTTESITRIVFNYPTSSVGYSTGISDDRKTIYKYLTGSVSGISTFVISSNLLNSTYRYALDTVGYPVTDYKFVLKNRDEVVYKGNSYFSTASLTSTGSFASSSYISGAAVVSYSLSNPLPAQIGISGSQITHITFAKSSSLSYVNLGTSSLGKVWEGYQDDGPVIPVATTFPINFLGKEYNTVYVTGNGYIMFDAITNSNGSYFAPVSSSSVPPIPNIKVGSSDLSLYKVYSGSTAGTFRIWVQERSDYPNGTPDREYSYIFYSGSERVDLYVDRMVLSTRVITSTGTIQQVSQISDGYTVYSNFSSSIYSGSGYALNLWDAPVTASTVKVKQLSGNTITAYGSASIDSNLINSDLYYVSFENRISTASQYAITSYSVKDTGSLPNLVISSVTYNSGTDDTTISLVASLQSDYTASIYSSSYIGLKSNNAIDFSINSISESVIKSNNLNSGFYSFLAKSPLTASSITLYRTEGYSKSINLISNYSKLGFRIMSSSYSGDITGSLFISYSVFPIGAYQSVAYGDYSQASGLGVVASSSYQYVFGKFNQLNDTTSTFVVAGGSDDQNRKNLLTVSADRTSISGSVDISGKISYDSGSFNISKFGSTFSSSISLTGFLSAISATSASYLKGSGSSILKVAGTYTNHLVISDDAISGSYSSSIFSISDLMGLPVFDTFYDSSVRMYQYPDVVFEKSGSSIYLGTNYTTESKAVIKSNLTFDRGSGVVHSTIQTTGSTISAVTSSINKYYFGSTSSSLYYNAIVSGYDTASREIIVGDVKSTIKFVAGVATVVGTNVRFLNAEDSMVNFNVVAGSTSASLEVYGSTGKAYNWAATITTQNF